jgi:hypothetical protein
MRFVGFLTGEVQHVWMRSSPVSSLLLIRLFQPKSDILGGVQPNTTTAGGDLKGPDKHELRGSFLVEKLCQYEYVRLNPFEVLTRLTLTHSLGARSHVVEPD